VIRVAAVGDLHVGPDSAGALREQLGAVHEKADVLLIAGDLTKSGEPEEAEALARELRDLSVQVVAVLGNHDHHADRPAEIAALLREAGVVVLEGDAFRIDTPAGSLGVAGVKGFGGGFPGASGAEFGEPEMKAFIRHTKERSEALESALATLETDVRIALLHYAPVRETLLGEPPEIFPFLGSYLLAEAVDRSGADLVIHGHAHRGTEHGVTPGGVNVRNVAQTVIRQAYAIYGFDAIGRTEPATAGRGSRERGSRDVASAAPVSERRPVQPTNEPIRYTAAEADITSRAITINPSDSHPLRGCAPRDLDRISMSRISGGAASPLRIAET
jgi:Icc-related predicted phosphoesterase